MTAPYGADAAGERNRAAVDQLTETATTTVGAAINDMLAAVLADLGNGTPVPDTLASRARSSWANAVRRVLAWVRETFTRLVSRAAANLPDTVIDNAPDLPARTIADRVGRIITQLGNDLRGVPDVLASRTATALGEGYARGESPAELRTRVAAVLDRDEWAAEVERIARTTTTTVYNAAHTAAADDLERQLGEPVRRMWIATGGAAGDGRTRETHRKAHAQVITRGERFQVGEARLRFPGDPMGPADEIVNCRCVVTAVVDDVVIDLAHRVTGKAYDVITSSWRHRLYAALVAATRIPHQLVTYWVAGKGAPRIRWGTDGSFRRCERALGKYIDPARLPGACANLYHLATGRWPGAHKGSVAAQQEGADMDTPCPCEGMTDDQLRAAAATLNAAPAPRPARRPADGDEPPAPPCDPDTDPDCDPDADPLVEESAVDTPVPCDPDDPDCMPEDQGRDDDGEHDEPSDDTGPEATNHSTSDGVEPEHPARQVVENSDEEDDPDCDPDDPDCDRTSDNADDVAAPSTAAGAEAAPAGSGGTVRAATLEEAQQGGMVALLPSADDAARLTVTGDGAIPADDLHMTLAFLGDDGAEYQGSEAGQTLLDLAARVAADISPITGTLWQTGMTGPDAETGATAMYLVGEDTGRLAELQAGVVLAGGDAIPEQRSPWVAHVSTRYGSGDLTGMDAVGSQVTFDRIRVSFGDEDTDFDLVGDDSLDLLDSTDMPDPDDTTGTDDQAAEPAPAAAATAAATPAVTGEPVSQLRVSLAAAVAADQIVALAAANAPEAPPAEWFRPVQVDGPTPPTVTAEGRVWGHIGQAGVCHVGIRDECVTIPPTRTGFGAFHKDEIITAEGDRLSVGYLYTGCEHSPLDASMDEARDYLDASCNRTAAGRVHDTEYGPLFVGSIMAGATPEHVAQLWKLSGEWFMAPLELHAAVGVDDAGFPVDGTGDAVRTAEQAPPLAASSRPDKTDTPKPKPPPGRKAAPGQGTAAATVAVAVTAINDYQRDRAGAAVTAAAHTRAARALADYQKRG